MTRPPTVFRPARGRWVPLAVAGTSVVLFGIIALILPGSEQGGPWGPVDRLLMGGLGLGIAAFLVRYALIEAVARTEGLWVRNLFLSRTIPWAEIEDVRYGGGEPWVTLDLVDGESVAVMAIQRADGMGGADDARRLAEFVAAGGLGRYPE